MKQNIILIRSVLVFGSLLLLPVKTWSSCSNPTKNCLCDENRGKMILRCPDFDCKAHCSGSSTPAVDPNTQMIDNITTGLGAIISIFKSAPASRSSYAPQSNTAPATFKGIVTTRSQSGPTASQQKVMSTLEARKQDVMWQPNRVAERIKPPPQSAKDDYEAMRETMCEMGFGYDPYAGATIKPDEIKKDGQIDFLMDTVAEVSGGVGPSWQTNAQAWCEPLPSFRTPPSQPAPSVPKMIKPQTGEKEGLKMTSDDKPPSKGWFIANIIDKPKKEVSAKKEETVILDKTLDDRKELEKMLKAAEKKAEKLPEEKKTSILAEVQAMRRRNDQAIGTMEQRKRQVAQELQEAQKNLTQTKQEAHQALKDDGKFQNFYDKHEGILNGDSGGAEALNKMKAGMADAGDPAPEDSSQAKKWKPSVHIWRPSSDEAYFAIEAQKTFGEESLPYADAPIKVSWGEASYQLIANPLGRVLLPPSLVEENWPAVDNSRVEIKAEMGKAAYSLTITRQELGHYLKSGAEILAGKGDEELAKNRHEEATRYYWQSLNWFPTEKASEGWLASLEKQGVKHSTLEAYRVALTRHVKDPSERLKLKQKAIATAHRLEPPPPVPSNAREHLDQGQEAFQKQDETNCLVHLEVASSLAPWWHEPYYSQSQVFQYLAFQKSIHFSQAAIQNYDLFLAAAPSDDPRITQAKSEKKDLEELRAMMSK